MSGVSDARLEFLTLEKKKVIFTSLMVVYLVLCLAYNFLPQGVSAFPWFFALFTIQFAVYGGFLWMLRELEPKLSYLIIVICLTRIFIIPSEPVLENDFWRYLWDGRVLAHGINPYSYKPLDPALDHLDVFYRQQIGWKQYGTIYPPVSIAIFAVTHMIFPDSLLGLKIILVFFEIATGVVLYFWFGKMGIPKKWVVLYFLNPLLLKEIANSAHLDAIVVFFSTLSVYLLWISIKLTGLNLRFSLGAWFFLALAVGAKLYPFCFVPLFFKIDKNRRYGLIIFLFTLFLFYSPFLKTGYSLINGTEAFAKYWIFNASVFKVIQIGISKTITYLDGISPLSPQILSFVLKNDCFAKVIVGGLFSIFIFVRTKKLKHADSLPTEIVYILGALLILSPVVNGWYFLWMLPFVSLTFNKPWLIYSYLIVAGYAWWFSKELSHYFKWFEYFSLFFFLLIWHYQPKKKMVVRSESQLL